MNFQNFISSTADFRAVLSVLPCSPSNKGTVRRIFWAAWKRLIDNEPSWLFDCHRMSTLKQRLRLQIDWHQKRAHFSVSFISLGHSACITFHISMPFRKPRHVPFRKLIPRFILTDLWTKYEDRHFSIMCRDFSI